LAVLCVKEHDIHHRPGAYPSFNHLDLSPEELGKKKISWENFVCESKKENPSVLATITCYGTVEFVHAMKIVFQWVDGKIEFEREYHLLDGPMDMWIDSAIDEVTWLGKNIKLVLINEPMPIEYCPCCSKSYSRTLDENIALKTTSPDWKEKSICTIYINPERPSLAYTIFYKKKVIYQASIHKCGAYLRFMDDKMEERFNILKRPSIRTQVTKLLQEKIDVWDISKKLIGTGNPDEPNLINEFTLPIVWEKC